MWVQVECHSGWKADERSVRFRLEGHEYTAEEILDQWCGPDYSFFKVRTDDGNVYVLRHETAVLGGSGSLFRLGSPGGPVDNRFRFLNRSKASGVCWRMPSQQTGSFEIPRSGLRNVWIVSLWSERKHFERL